MTGSEALIYAYMAGTAAQMVGKDEQERKQKNILNRSLAEADDTQEKAAGTLMQEARQMAPEARQQAMATAEQGAYDRSMKDVAGGGAMVDTVQGGGAMSDDFTRGKAASDAAEGSRLSAMVRNLSRVRAPQDVTTDEAMRRSSIAEQLGSLWSSQRGRSRAASQDAQSVDMPDYGQLGGLTATVSGAMLAGGAGGGAAGGAEGAATFGGESAAMSGVPAWDAAFAAVPQSSSPYLATAAQSAAAKQKARPWWWTGGQQ